MMKSLVSSLYPSRALVVAGLAFATACSDGLRPDPEVSLLIHRDAERIRETSVMVDGSVQLTARFGGGSGNATHESPGDPVSWWSEDPTIASVESSAEATAIVRGVAFGSTRIVASSGAAADTVVVSVLAGIGAACEEGGVALAVGESITSNAATAMPLCLSAAPSGGAEYLVVPFNAASAGGKLRAEVTGEGIAEPFATAERIEAGNGSATLATTDDRFDIRAATGGANDRAAEFDRRLRERERRELAPLVGPRPAVDRSDASARAELAAAIVTPVVGQILQLNVNSAETCTSPAMRNARVAAVGDRVVMLEDMSNPFGGFTAAEYQSLVDSYDRHVHPVLTNNFGTATDIDGNGRVLVLVTREVNALTPAGSDSYVAGFFFARDLFPMSDTGWLRGCATSNNAEILYLLAPDPDGLVNGNKRSKQAVLTRTLGVIAHEAQHMVNAARRLHILRNQNWGEAFWLNEGLSHIAEELTFYATTNLRPREELTLVRVRSTAQGISRLNEFQLANFARFSDYLHDPAAVSPIDGDGLATRGASWAFLRYAVDRRGGDEAQLWRTLVDADLTGYDNLLAALGTSPLAWLHDWTLANYVDDFVAGMPSRFRQPSWDFRSILPEISTNGGRYPLRVIDLAPSTGGRAEVELVAAGSAVVRFRAPPGGETRVSVTSGGATAPSPLRVTVLRVR
jgi:hypothetical protein